MSIDNFQGSKARLDEIIHEFESTEFNGILVFVYTFFLKIDLRDYLIFSENKMHRKS